VASLVHGFPPAPAPVHWYETLPEGNFSLSLAELGYEVTWNELREDLVESLRVHSSQLSV